MAFQPVNTNLSSVTTKALTDRATTFAANDLRQGAEVKDQAELSQPEQKKSGKSRHHRKSGSSSKSRRSGSSKSTKQAAPLQSVQAEAQSALSEARAKFYGSLGEMSTASPVAKQFLEETKKALVEDKTMSGVQKELVLAQRVQVFAYDVLAEVDKVRTAGQLTQEQEQGLRSQAEPIAKAALAAHALVESYSKQQTNLGVNPQELNFEAAQPGAGVNQPPLATPQNPPPGSADPGSPPPPGDPNQPPSLTPEQQKEKEAKEKAEAEQAEIQKIMQQMWEDRKKWMEEMWKLIQDTNKQIFEMWSAINQSRIDAIQKGIETFNDYLNTW